jgi:hypothetical protein
MKTITSLLVAIVILFAVFQPVQATTSAYASIPTFSIVSVVTDTSVTIKTYNFPANVTFTVKMGAYGTNGVGGIVITTTDSGTGGSFVATYTIPAALKGYAKIAIRLESSASGYYAYNWFTNATGSSSSGSTSTSGYSGYPYFYIQSVVSDSSVTIKAYNFPANEIFTVKMGAYGSYGVGGTVVGTTDSGAGGSFIATYYIPTKYKGSYQIAMRLEGKTTPYFAYNWFYNSTAPAPTTTPGPTPTPGPVYTGIPTISIVSVVKNNSVTIKASNFPAHDSFKVTMGAYGTLGIGGKVVATTDSGAGGSFTVTYTIPASLSGSARIAIRLQSAASGYYAYNWFYNSTTP